MSNNINVVDLNISDISNIHFNNDNNSIINFDTLHNNDNHLPNDNHLSNIIHSNHIHFSNTNVLNYDNVNCCVTHSFSHNYKSIIKSETFIHAIQNILPLSNLNHNGNINHNSNINHTSYLENQDFFIVVPFFFTHNKNSYTIHNGYIKKDCEREYSLFFIIQHNNIPILNTFFKNRWIIDIKYYSTFECKGLINSFFGSREYFILIDNFGIKYTATRRKYPFNTMNHIKKNSFYYNNFIVNMPDLLLFQNCVLPLQSKFIHFNIQDFHSLFKNNQMSDSEIDFFLYNMQLFQNYFPNLQQDKSLGIDKNQNYTFELNLSDWRHSISSFFNQNINNDNFDISLNSDFHTKQITSSKYSILSFDIKSSGSYFIKDIQKCIQFKDIYKDL